MAKKKKNKKQRKMAQLESANKNQARKHPAKQASARQPKAEGGHAAAKAHKASAPHKPKARAVGPVVLRVKDLHTKFHTPDAIVHAVRGVSFDLHRGEVLGIVGESGSGKSVTNLALMGLIRPPGVVTAEAIELMGQSIKGLDTNAMRRLRGDRLAMIFQDPMTSLNPFLTIGDQISESLVLHKNMSTADAMGRAVELLEDVGIPDPRRRVTEYPHQFSGGMRQRVMIAMALACDPDVLIADEPTTALDVTIQAQILELLLKLRNKRGMAIIFITHDLGVVAGVCDRVLVMYGGKIIEENKTGPLFADPRHPYTDALMRSLPRLDADAHGDLEVIEGMPPDLSRAIPGCAFEPRCRYAEDRCSRVLPPLEPHGGGRAACYVNWK